MSLMTKGPSGSLMLIPIIVSTILYYYIYNVMHMSGSGQTRQRGFLCRNKEELKRALESSRKGLALSRVFSVGPHFIPKDKKS